MISAVTQVHWVEWPCLSLRCIISHRKVWQDPNLASLRIFCQVTWEDTFHSFETLDNGNNILRQSINLDRFGRFVQLHKESVKHFLSMNTIMRCPTSNKPLLTLFMHNSVALLFLIITGIPIHRESLTGK